jgi:hypothetical protein
MQRQGYALTTDRALGLPRKFRQNFRQAHYNEHSLRHDEGDRPADRERARDVVLYEWAGDTPRLEEYETIALTDRAEIAGERTHLRNEILSDPEAHDLITRLLSLVPPARRQGKGTFGVNLFRTHSDVVTKSHKDDEQFIILYVLHRDGDGARSYLYETDPGPTVAQERSELRAKDLVLDQQLNPGDLLIFEDDRFLHGATNLEPLPDGRSLRDALVCTVDYDTTYLSKAPA